MPGHLGESITVRHPLCTHKAAQGSTLCEACQLLPVAKLQERALAGAERTAGCVAAAAGGNVASLPGSKLEGSGRDELLGREAMQRAGAAALTQTCRSQAAQIAALQKQLDAVHDAGVARDEDMTPKRVLDLLESAESSGECRAA